MKNITELKKELREINKERLSWEQNKKEAEHAIFNCEEKAKEIEKQISEVNQKEK